MELSPPWEVISCSATQKLQNISSNTKVRYRVHKNPLMDPVLSQVNPVHTTLSYFSKIHLILTSHLRLGLPSSLFPSGFPHACYMPWPSRHPLLNHYNYIWRIVQVVKHLKVHISPTPPLLHPSTVLIFSSAPSSQIPLMYVISLILETKFHNQTKCKIMVLYITIFTFFDSRREDKRFWRE
jgi:hypothetical protein